MKIRLQRKNIYTLLNETIFHDIQEDNNLCTNTARHTDDTNMILYAQDVQVFILMTD